jgi:hypothetical protein
LLLFVGNELNHPKKLRPAEDVYNRIKVLFSFFFSLFFLISIADDNFIEQWDGDLDKNFKIGYEDRIEGEKVTTII